MDTITPNQYATWAQYYGDRIKKMCDEVEKLRKSSIFGKDFFDLIVGKDGRN